VIDYKTLVALADGRRTADTRCPLCSDLRQRRNRHKPVLRIWVDTGFATYYCAHCEAKGYAHDGTRREITDTARKLFALRKAEANELAEQKARERRGTARWLWGRGIPAHGTIVEKYLRSRNISTLPPTIRFLEARENHPPSMMSAFGLATEPEPGKVAIADDAITGVHLTALQSDGSGKANIEKPKIIIGHRVTEPIVLAPMNDLLCLALTEGIEEALPAMNYLESEPGRQVAPIACREWLRGCPIIRIAFV
jgi:hypothetical protein